MCTLTASPSAAAWNKGSRSSFVLGFKDLFNFICVVKRLRGKGWEEKIFGGGKEDGGNGGGGGGGGGGWGGGDEPACCLPIFFEYFLEFLLNFFESLLGSKP